MREVTVGCRKAEQAALLHALLDKKMLIVRCSVILLGLSGLERSIYRENPKHEMHVERTSRPWMGKSGVLGGPGSIFSEGGTYGVAIGGEASRQA